MEDLVEKSVLENYTTEEEKRPKSNGDDQEAFFIEETKKVPLLTSSERSSMEINLKDSSSIQKDQEDQLESAKAKMGEAREENERLKLLLAQIVKDYQYLKMRFFDILQQEAKKSTDSPTHQENEHELVSLSLGRASNTEPKKEKSNDDLSNCKENEGLALGLDCRFEPAAGSMETVKNPISSENSCGELKEEEPTEVCPPGKVAKTMRSGDEEVLGETHLKKARVSVRARCDTPTMNDGCQWRKYGQKISKGNPCPRAYYRCTVSPTCPVRKQVQRCTEDMSILTTTYEGTHNHPLSISATAMASTTCAAVSMLQSQSSTSQPGLGTTPATAPIFTSSSTTAANLHGLNFSSNTLINSQNSRPQQFYLPNSSISTSNSHPTITLDLTRPPTSSFFNRSIFPTPPRYINSSTCLNFSSSPSSNHSSFELNITNPHHLNFGTLPAYSRNHNNFGALNIGNRQLPLHEHFYQPYNNDAQMIINQQAAPHDHHQQSNMTETIAAATKVITSNPSFQSALAAALTSFVGNRYGGGGGGGENHGGGTEVNSGLNLKCVESFPVNTAYPVTQNGTSSYLDKSISSQQEQGSLHLFPNSLPFSTSKSGSLSPADNRDDNK